jgi:hypothetical protein
MWGGTSLKIKHLERILLFTLLPLLSCAVLSVLLVPGVRSDLYPYPENYHGYHLGTENLYDVALWLPSETVTIDVSPNVNGYIAKVRGVYPFYFSGYATTENLLENLMEDARSEIAMMCPVPPNSENISVEAFAENIEWEWTDNAYSTELGNFPIFRCAFRIPENIIRTTISGAGGSVATDIFNIVVEYAHQIPLENGRYTLLYSLGAAGSLGPYDYWEHGAMAHVETNLPKEVKIFENKLTMFPSDQPPEFNIDNENNTVTITYPLGRDTGDYVVEFTTPVPPAPSGGVSPLIYVGVAVGIVVIIGAVMILKFV